MTIRLLSEWTCDDCGVVGEAGVCWSPSPAWFAWQPKIGVIYHRCPACEARRSPESTPGKEIGS